MNSETPTASRPELTIVIPAYNEEGSLEELYRRLREVLDGYGKTYEILFIEDGSRDRTFEMLSALHAEDPRVRVIQFMRNFGQQMAITAGFQYARGEVVVLLDADLQTPPEEIPRLVDKVNEGYEIAYGIRQYRMDSFLRRAGSWVMSKLLYRITGINIPDSASGFFALNRRFVETINMYNEKSRYLSGLLAWLSYGRGGTIPVSHSARYAGKSKYSLWQLVMLTLTFVCNFTVLPLRIGLFTGAAVMALSLAGFAWAGGVAVFGEGTLDPLWFLGLTLGFVSGVQLVAIGALGEYIGRIYGEVRGQPNFVVRTILERPLE